MAKVWRVVMTVVILLAAAGVVLIGAAWLTGASPTRIVELVFVGPEGVRTWWAAANNAVSTVWNGVLDFLRGLF